MDRKLANSLLARTMWSMYDTVESTVQFCRQKPNVHNRTLLKNTYEISLIQRASVWSDVTIFERKYVFTYIIFLRTLYTTVIQTWCNLLYSLFTLCSNVKLILKTNLYNIKPLRKPNQFKLLPVIKLCFKANFTRCTFYSDGVHGLSLS